MPRGPRHPRGGGSLFCVGPGRAGPGFPPVARPRRPPAIMSPGVGPGSVGPPNDASRRVRQAIAPRHPARWRGVFVIWDLAWRHLPLAHPPLAVWRGGEVAAMPEAPLRDGKAPLARRASPRVGSGRSSSHGSRPSLEQGGDPRCRPPCVVAIGFDGTRRLPSWRFRPASEAVCLEPCRRGCGSGVTARRREDFLWVVSLDSPIRVSSVRRVWIGAHGFLYKTDAFGLRRRVGRS